MNDRLPPHEFRGMSYPARFVEVERPPAPLAPSQILGAPAQSPTGLTVTTQTWPPLAVALVRGAIEGVVLGGLSATTALGMDVDPRKAIVGAGAILFGRLAIALGVGGLDQVNSRKVQP